MKKNSGTGLLILIMLMSIFIGAVAGFFGSNLICSSRIRKLEDDLNASQVRAKELEDKTKEANENKKTKGEINADSLKNLSDAYLETDTNLEKAKKIAEDVKNAINEEDWYYLAKVVGSETDYLIKYGISNYTIDQFYSELNGEFIFYVSYDWDKTRLSSPKDISLGKMLTVQFAEDGKINISIFATGI